MNIFLKATILFAVSFMGVGFVVGQDKSSLDIESVSSEQTTLRIATIVREPFVVQDGPELAGFSIDLWNLVAARNSWKSEFVLTNRFVELLNSVKEPAEVDAAIANISITSDREKVMDFSSAIFDGGLQILIPKKENRAAILPAITTRNVGLLVLLFLSSFIVLGYIMSKFAVAKSWKNSLVGSYWNLITMGQYGDALPKKNSTKAIFVLWIMVSTIFLVTATAEITSTMIADKTGRNISSYLDLQNKLVGVSAGSTSENYMRANNISTVSYDSIDDMFEQVARGDLDAVVHDAPVVQHYATYNGRGRVATVGEVFNKEQYGIALPDGSLLREQINTTLLQIKEDGTYDNLYDKWFNK